MLNKLLGGGKQPQWKQPPEMGIDPAKQYTATIQTTEGTMTAQLLPAEAPKTVNNFVFLAREEFYDGVPFHRVMKGFMVQTGDPTGTGSGGPGYRFADEPIRSDYEPGTLAMANSGPNTNGSQFFITVTDTSWLTGKHTIFGEVVEGYDVVEKISKVSRDGMDRPKTPVVLESVTIERVA